MVVNMLQKVQFSAKIAFNGLCRRGIAVTTVRHDLGKHDAYYVLLPEVPPDTPETNTIMRVTEPPEFKSIKPETVVTGCAKLAIEYETELGDLVEQLHDPNLPKNFSTVFEPIEKILVPMNCAWRTAKQLGLASGNNAYKQSFKRVHQQVESAKNERWLSHPLCNAVKELKADRANLDECQESLVDLYLLESRLNGLELDGGKKDKFLSALKNVVELKSFYRRNVAVTQNLFKHTFMDKSEVRCLPDWFKKATAIDKHNPSKGPWQLTLQKDIYQPFMEYSNNRLLRWNAWIAKNQVASWEFDDRNLSNHKVIGDIRVHRRDIANLLGYENYAEMSMETKMAGNIENVMNLIESCKSHFKDDSHKDIVELQEFAIRQGFDSRLELWDLDFWRRRQREDILGCSEDDLSQYFTLSKVLEGLFNLCSKLFAIQIKDCTDEVDAWDSSVSFYRIYSEDGTTEVASFYLDPYLRPSKLNDCWMESGRENSAIYGTKPMSYLNLNLTPPLLNRPATLLLKDVENLFSEFGNGLQQMLTTVPYSEVAGQRNIQGDTLQVCSLFFTKWLYQGDVLRSISGQVDNGSPLSDDQIASIQRLSKHMNAYNIMRILYFSAFDMEMYVSKEYFYSVQEKLWPEFNVFQLHELDIHPCSLTPVFSDQYPAGFYSFIWAQMIAADVFGAFEEAGQENDEKIKILGQRFRDTYLSLGGAVPAGEVFRRFRGRDPSVESLFNKSQ